MTRQTTHTTIPKNIAATAMDSAEPYPEILLPLDKGKPLAATPQRSWEGKAVLPIRKIQWTMEEKQASYEEIHGLLRAATEENSLEALEKLLEKIQPILQKSCRHFFGATSEDLLQEGCLCAIQLIRRYDPDRENVKFLGYMKKMMMFFYWDRKKKDIKEKERLICAEDHQLDQGMSEPGFETAELLDAIHRLESKEQRIIKEHVMDQKQLNLLCREMDISYAYGKELKRKALDQLRRDCFTLRLPKQARVICSKKEKQ